MVRLLRILCVSSIATLLIISLLMFNKTINLFDWITYTKVTFSVLVYSLVYLLLDKKRKSIIGKIALTSTTFGAMILLLSLVIQSLNLYWNIAFGAFILSFILLLFSKTSNANKALKPIFYVAFIIPIGILLGIENGLFYTISGIVLTLISVTSVIYSLKK